MSYKTLISTVDLKNNLDKDNWLIVDCRFNLVDTNEGHALYHQGHIPNAIYAHLDDNLSGQILPGKTGRHPLPEIDKLSGLFSSWGINQDTQVVAYDGAAGPFAARLWWLLRWLGHENVAVLNGGFKQWQAEGGEVALNKKHSALKPTLKSTLDPAIQSGEMQFNAVINSKMLVDADIVFSSLPELQNKSVCLLDARTSDRFCGENETLDPKAGHIPGAISSPFIDNLNEDGLFKDKQALKKMYTGKVANCNPENIIVYCGSGITAAHNILAMEYAGLPGAKLYAGSWSHWITDDRHPVAIC
ncbi:MAG: sulfurtransferase [Gammaproteobacteria bacterium]|nr:sulfurtransferase [Gammaproteobacteria bacterium]